MRALIGVLLLALLLLLASCALATTTPTGTWSAPTVAAVAAPTLAMANGLSSANIQVAGTDSSLKHAYYASSAGAADELEGPTPTARTGPMVSVVYPCARDYALADFTRENTYCDDELHPAAPTADNLGARRQIRMSTTTSAAFAT